MFFVENNVMTPSLLAQFDAYCKKHAIDEKERAQLLEKLKEEIVKYLYEPAEAIGIVAAQSISEPATQMSTDAREKIVVKHRDRIAIHEIGSFTDGMLTSRRIHHDDWDIANLDDMDLFVPSITCNEKIVWSRLLACSRHPAPDKLLRIRTLSGRHIVATRSHSFVTRKDNTIVAVAGSTLAPGDRIPSLKSLPENCIHSVNIRQLTEPSFSRARKPLPEELQLNETTGWIFGAYLSEGNCTPHFVCISNTNENFLERTRQFADAFGVTYNEYDNVRGFAKGHDVHINSTVLARLLASTCGNGSKNKKIPSFSLFDD